MVERHKNAFIQQERPHQFLEALPDISPILPLECLRRRVGQALGKLVLLNGSCEAVLPAPTGISEHAQRRDAGGYS